MIDIISKVAVPPGGWMCRCGAYEIRGESYEELVKNVQQHHESNGIHNKNIEIFVQMQIAERWPAGKIRRDDGYNL